MLGDFVALRCNVFVDLFRDVSHETTCFETTFGMLIKQVLFLVILTPWREPCYRRRVFNFKKYDLRRFLTPGEPGDKEGLIFSKNCNLLRFLTPRREPGDKEGLLIL